MVDIPLNAENCWIERDQFIVTASYSTAITLGPLAIGGINTRGSYPLFCQWTYVNGWANTFSTAVASAGATSITVTEAVGIYPGQSLTIWDGMNDEQVTVASTYTTGSTTVTLASPLKNNHGVGVNISALPATVKQAVIHFVVGMIKERGQGGLVLNEIGEPSAVTSRQMSAVEDMSAAYDLLDDFKAVWGRA